METSVITVVHGEIDVSRLESIYARMVGRKNLELVVVDHLPAQQNEPSLLLRRTGIPYQYYWCSGYNELYGGGINRAVKLASGERVVYFSAKRGRALDPTWLDDLLAPLDDGRVGMAGCVQPCNCSVLAEPCALPEDHVQGGVWAARREVLLANPYSTRFWQVYSDVWISNRLKKTGYRLADVPSVKAVAGGIIPRPERFKFVVDYV